MGGAPDRGFKDKHLRFEPRLRPNRKTHTWAVWSDAGVYLGVIEWYSPWRRYVFYPNSGTLFDSECLMLLQDFIDAEMEKRKTRRPR